MFNFEKIIFTGKIIKPLPFVNNNDNKDINPKFEAMLKEWFYYFSKGENVMNMQEAFSHLFHLARRISRSEITESLREE